MQVILKSISHPSLDDIVVTDELFPVGRGEDPFFTYDPELIAHLSRRHARIFIEADGAYVADLGSRNGTQLNKKAVEFKPTRLLAGDLLSFASQLDYQVELVGQAREPDPVDASALCLTLEPEDADSLLSPIAISVFPFLIGKSEPAFSESSDAKPEKLSYLSRRHAHFFARGGAIYLEDLGSTNGTTLNGKRLEEHAAVVSDGDRIVFGGNHFAYRIALNATALVAGQASQAIEEDDECHTIHVSAANTFLDIFCVDDAEEEASEPDALPTGSGVSDTPATTVSRPTIWSKVTTFTRELKIAFVEEGSSSSRTKLIASAIVLLAVSLGTAAYFSGKTLRDIKSLLAAEQYLDSAEMADDYLVDHPDDEDIELLATEALTKYFAANWMELIAVQAFTRADALIEDSRALTSANETGANILDLLAWSTDLLRFMSDRGGSQAPIRIYDHEDTMNALLQWWDRDPEEHRSTMRMVVNYAPGFSRIDARISSQLRSLRNEKSVYLTAIDKLKNKIEHSLQAGTEQLLAKEISNFSAQYPRLGGLDRLQNDLAAYLAINAAIETGDRLQAALLVENTDFSTPPFIAKIDSLKATLLPSAKVTRRYGLAATAWREGKLAESLNILEDLASQQGGELAGGKLKTKQKIIDDYARLQLYRNTAQYSERLITFYSTLDPAEDTHFTQLLDRDFQRYGAQAKAMADSAWDTALAHWGEYRNSGGIRGLLRLEEQVSPRFSQQATLLSEAYANANYGKQTYELLGLEYSSARGALFGQIGAEAALQRRSLTQLSMVLGPEVLAAKLNMLNTTDSDRMKQLN